MKTTKVEKANTSKEECWKYRAIRLSTASPLPSFYFYLPLYRSGMIFGTLMAVLFVIATIYFHKQDVLFLDINCMGIALSAFILRFLTGFKWFNMDAGSSEQLFKGYYCVSDISVYEKYNSDIKRLRLFFVLVTVFGRFFELYLPLLMPFLLKNVISYVLFVVYAVVLWFGKYISDSRHNETTPIVHFCTGTLPQIAMFICGIYIKRLYPQNILLFDKKYFFGGLLIGFIWLAIPVVSSFLFRSAKEKSDIVELNKIFDVHVCAKDSSWKKTDIQLYKQFRPLTEEEILQEKREKARLEEQERQEQRQKERERRQRQEEAERRQREYESKRELEEKRQKKEREERARQKQKEFEESKRASTEMLGAGDSFEREIKKKTVDRAKVKR